MIFHGRLKVFSVLSKSAALNYEGMRHFGFFYDLNDINKDRLLDAMHLYKNFHLDNF